MNFLEERIVKDGIVKEGNVLKVDSFLNHQMDVRLFDQIGEEFKRRFADEKINKILTIEASGIGIACIVARHFDVPVIFAKKSKSINIEGDVYVAEVESFTHKCKNQVIVSKKFLNPEDKVLIIPRVYTNKPRTTGEGYKGMVHQPDPEGKPDLLHGLIAMRKMHIRAIEESGLTCADEMLYPENWGYVEDLLSYVAIGARSVEDQQHRLTVSGFDVASGMKNPTSGDFSVMLNSVYAAQHPHHFVYRGYEVETTGNPLTHVVLRGAVSKHGNTTQNYHYEDLIRLHEMYEKMDVIHPAAIIDTNHSNSGKKFKEQIRIAKEVMHNRQLSSDIRSLVKGLMIESYIEPGNQKIGGTHIYGKSITDPCLGWEESEKLLYTIAEMC